MYSPRGGGGSGGPGPNALAMPQQQNTAPIGNNALAGNLGSGLMQGAADLQKQYPIWQQEYENGTTTLQFSDWLRSKGQQNPVMPRQNSLGYAPA